MNDNKNDDKEKNTGNPLIVLGIFIVIIGFIMYVPELYSKYNTNVIDFFGGNDTTNNIDDTKEAVSTYYQIGSNGTLEFNDIIISNVVLKEDVLEFNVNKSLDDLDYYIEFYENKSVFIGRRELKGNNNISIDISNMNITSVTYFVISHISDSSIPRINLSTDESGLGSIVCTNDDMYEYEYTFSNNSLVKYRRVYTYTSSDIDEYSKKVFDIQKEVNNYNSYNGVTASVVLNNSTFIYTLELDYDVINAYNNIEDNYKFSKGIEAGIIKFKMDAWGYSCK